MGSRLTLRLATELDLRTVLKLIDTASEWLQREKNTDQWLRPWPSRTGRDERVLNSLLKNETWILRDARRPIGTITATSVANPQLWQEQERAETAVYVHRLVIHHRHRGCGLGAALLDWADQFGARQFGAEWARIDVWTTNLDLQAYYESQRFTLLRICDVPNYPSGALFQRPIEPDDGKPLPFVVEP
jgi:GNAT superfamily N-acetyltransferase